MNSPEIIKCPRCIDEELKKAIGNILVCESCDLVLIDTREPMFEEPEPEAA